MLDEIKRRRSIRSYTDEKINKDDLTSLLEAAMLAPTAGNLQPCYFYVVENPEKLKELYTKANYTKGTWELSSTACIVIATDPDISKNVYGKRGENIYNIQDSAAAAQNILLQATNLGIGSCWIGAFDEKICKEILNMPDNQIPRVIISLGYAKKQPRERPTKTLEELTTWIG